ncbi:hypothetical protein WMF18_14715 [Sorangium sp. So ce315]|uniref:hypothetical protein n=1 Tax=Sorangium sp. So ce315 TaxID=3133299 RepID=UPI003F5F3564
MRTRNKKRSALHWMILTGGALFSVLESGATAMAQGGSYFTTWQAFEPTNPEIIQNGGKIFAVGLPERGDYDDVIISNTLAGLPTAIETRGWGLATLDPALDWISSNGYALDYLFMDIEGDTQAQHDLLLDNIDRVRSDPDAGISGAYVGNYNYYPGMSVDTTPMWPWDYGAQFRIDREDIYYTSGLNIAMPVAYNWSQAVLHTSPSHSGIYYVDGTAPTPIAAIFWHGLETVSVAARHLPDGHLLIPYIADFMHKPFYGVPQSQVLLPTDNAAQVQHYRLRGADGFRTWQVNSDQSEVTTYYFQTYGNTIDATLAFTTDMADAWQALDGVFDRSGALRVLNLRTNKNAGIQWSGIQRGSRVDVLVSNLNTTTQHVDWSHVAALPSRSPDVAYHDHVRLQYQSSVTDREDYEQHVLGNAMDDQGANSWSGATPDEFEIDSPPGSGNDSDQCIVSTGGYSGKTSWFEFDGPAFDSTDEVVYSGLLYNAISGVSFEPINVAGASPTGTAGHAYQGPTVSMAWGALRLREGYDGGDVYQAVNIPATMNEWLEVKMVINPNVGTGLGSLYVRNLTDGQTDFTRVVFDNLNTTGVTERALHVPLALGVNRNPTNFNGFVVAAYGAGNALDDLSVGYHVRQMNDNFEHYQSGVTMDSQITPELVWNGPVSGGPGQFTVSAPYGTGNTSTLAVSPTGSSTASAWWSTELPDYDASDVTVYSGQLYGTTGVYFAPVNTATSASNNITPNNYVGFMAQFEQGELRLRGSRDSGEVYKATNFAPASGKWYDIQVQVDPNRDIDGAAGGDFGVARVWVKNLTDDTAPVLVEFDKMSTTGVVESLLEVPLLLNTTTRNPATWNGWEVGSSNSSVQIDNLRSALYPYIDFVNRSQYIDG